MGRPSKLLNLLRAIAACIDGGRYLDTRHARERQVERHILRSDLLYVLLHGYHEKRKDKFEEHFNAWNYSIRGKTVDRRELRVIVALDASGMLIITAIELKR